MSNHKEQEIQSISLPINEYLEDMLSDRPMDCVHTRLHTAELIALKDPDEVYCHVQFTSFDGSRVFSKPCVWKIRAWRDSYNKWLADKHRAERERREANLLTENMQRLIRRMKIKGGGLSDEIYKELAYRICKEKEKEIAEMFDSQFEV